MVIQENGSKRKKIIFIASTAVIVVAIIAGLLIFGFSGAQSSIGASNGSAIAETPQPTKTPWPTFTPTETPFPTSTPLPADRVGKCKDSDNPGTVHLLPDWKIGDTRSIVVSRYRQRVVRRKASVIVQSYTKYRIRVLDATPTGYMLEWSVEDSQVQKGSDARNLTVDDMFLQDMLTLRSGLRIVYETDANGAYKQIDNWDQILAFHEQLHELFKLRLGQLIRNTKTLDKVLAAIEPVWNDQSQIEQLYSQEIRAYHGVYGVSASRLQGLRRADSLPNLLGYFPLEAETEISLNTYNAESGCAFLDLRRHLAPTSMPQLLKDFLTRQTQISSHSASTSDMASTRIEDNVRYNIDLNSSWLQSTQLKRITMVETLNMVEGIIISDMPQESP